MSHSRVFAGSLSDSPAMSRTFAQKLSMVLGSAKIEELGRGKLKARSDLISDALNRAFVDRRFKRRR